MFRLWQFVLNLLFPPNCLRCNTEGLWLCVRCAETFPRTLATDGSAYSLFPYTQAWVADAIHRMKYDGVAAIAEVFGTMLAKRWRTNDTTRTVVTAIPMHRQRERERGFNQAERIARAFATQAGYRYLPLLERTRATAAQATLDREHRLKNLRNVFRLRQTLKPRRLDEEAQLVFSYDSVILIDDVRTTGATLEEATRLLREGGIATVHALTVAYAPKQRGEVRRMVRQRFAKP